MNRRIRRELDKLASNAAPGRNRASLHYRSDGVKELSSVPDATDEAAAIRFLADQLSLPARVGDVRLSLETVFGERVTVEPTVR